MGAPKGDRNALKHRLRSAEMHAFRGELRQFLRRVRFDVAWAKAAHAARTHPLCDAGTGVCAWRYPRTGWAEFSLARRDAWPERDTSASPIAKNGNGRATENMAADGKIGAAKAANFVAAAKITSAANPDMAEAGKSTTPGRIAA